MTNKTALLGLMLSSIAVFLMSSCSLERLFPARVADGAARLSVNNFAKLIYAISELPSTDERPECNLKDYFSGTPKIVDFGNGKGKGTYSFKNCTYDFKDTGTTLEFPSTCGSRKTVFYGKVTITGSRTYSGILTGNVNVPIIPSGKDTLVFSFEKVVFENYKVESDSQKYVMTNNSGSVAFDMTIQLGKNRENRHCAVPLPNPTLTNIRYAPNDDAPAIVTLPGVSGNFQAEISKSNFQAQVAIDQRQDSPRPTNSLLGTMTVFGETVHLTYDKSYRLEPTLTIDTATTGFYEDLRCLDELDPYPDNTCSFEMETATGIGQLTVNNIARLIQAASTQDEILRSMSIKPECFLAETKNPTFLPQSESGDIVYEFRNCVFDFGSAGTAITLDDPDGRPFLFYGKITLSGKKTINGRLTGNKNKPVVPIQPLVRFEIFDAQFANFEVKSPALEQSLLLKTGSLSFLMDVHLQKEGDFDILRKPKPNFTIDKLKFAKGTQVVLNNTKGEYKGDFNFTIDGSDIHAQNEKFLEEENLIFGDMDFLGNKVEIKKQALVPGKTRNFETEDHEATLQKLDAFLADNAARLSIFNAGSLIAVLAKQKLPFGDTRPECDLSNFSFDSRYTNITEDGGTQRKGTVTWNFSNCTYRFGTNGTSLPVRQGEESIFFGNVTISGKRIIRAYLTKNLNAPVISDEGNVIFEIEKITFDNFKVLSDKLDYTLAMSSLDSSFTTIVHLGMNQETKLLTEPQENLTFKNFSLKEPTSLTLTALKGEFVGDHFLPSASSQFDAQVGEYDGSQNTLFGKFKVFGNWIQIPSDGRGLNPEVPQSRGPSSATTHRHDSLEYFKAIMVARFLVRNLGAIASLANSESLKSSMWPGCGFSSRWTRLNPIVVDGNIGAPGTISYAIDECMITDQLTDARVAQVCLPFIEDRIKGTAIVTGTQTIKGERSSYWRVSTVIPRHPKSVEFRFSSIEPINFSSTPEFTQNAPEYQGTLELKSGQFSANIFPITTASFANETDPCDFSQSTPISRFQIFHVNNLNVTFSFSYKNSPFVEEQKLIITSANLEAFNGFFEGQGNYLDGFIEINNQRFEFDKKIDVLVPNFNQEDFDLQYACRVNRASADGIRAVIAPNSFPPILDCPNYPNQP